MDTQKLYDLIDKVIGKKGPLRVPAYWMRRVLNDVVGAVDGNTTDISKLEAKINSLEASLANEKNRIDDTNTRIDETDSKVKDVNERVDSFIDYLTFIAEEDGLTINFTNNSSSIEYRIDDGEWIKHDAASKTPAVSVGQRISLRGNLQPNIYYGIGVIALSAACSAEGTPMSLLYGNERILDKVPEYAFFKLFYNQKNLKSVSKDFLPATTLDYRCYYYMFQNCTSLVNAPELPATTLAKNCYEYMFHGCSKLSYIKAMFTTKPGSQYTLNWASGVAPTGTFVKNAAATWYVTGSNGVPEGWTVETV